MALLSGCTPSLSPLYRDFEAPARPSETEVTQRVESALKEADWIIASSAKGVVVTEPRTLQDWGIYEINVYLEVLPMNESYARVMFHPFRTYFFGHETKLLFLKSDIRDDVLPSLKKAFESHGFTSIGTAQSRAEGRDA